MTVDEIAEIAHALNRAYCFALGDISQPVWSEAPRWQKDSARAGVRFHLANPNASAGASHLAWMREKLMDGWVFGGEKDAGKRTHPCLVAFSELPTEQQIKDVLFSQTVRALAPLCEEKLED